MGQRMRWRAYATLTLLALHLRTSTASMSSWQSVKHKFIGGPYAGAAGQAVGSGSVGVEDFTDDAEAIKAIRMFPGVMKSYGGLQRDASDAEVAAKFLPAAKVMLPNNGYFHDVLYNIKMIDTNTMECVTGDMQLTKPTRQGEWGQPYAVGYTRPVKTTMRVLDNMVEMDLHGVEKWAWRTNVSRRDL